MSQTTGKQKSSSELVKTPQFKKMLMKMKQYELINRFKYRWEVLFGRTDKFKSRASKSYIY